MACFTFVASGQEPTSRPSERPALTDKQQQIVQKLVQQRAQAIEAQKRFIQEYPPPRRADKQAAAQRAAALRAARARLNALQDKRKVFLPELPGFKKWEVGMVGVPDVHMRWAVEQVLGDDEALVTFTYIIAVRVAFGTQEWREETSRPYRLKGYPMKGVVTGTEIDMSKLVLHVKGTKTYSTANGGSNTTFVLEVVDPAVVRAFEAAVKEEHTKRRKKA